MTSVCINSRLLLLPKEVLLEIITFVALDKNLFPLSLLELSQCCKYLYHLVHKDPKQTLWPCAFHHRFDTKAIYRRRLHYNLNWQSLYKKRCRTLYQCYSLISNQHSNQQLQLLIDKINWEIIWDMITEHDHYNIQHLLDYKVHMAAGIVFHFQDRKLYPIILPMLSLLVNYDFSITQFFHIQDTSIVSNELSQFAYNFEADTLITQHTPFRYFHSWSNNQQQKHKPLHFYPSQDPLSSAFHLFFTTIFAHHPNIYQAIPNCIPIPLFQQSSELFDVEYLRRYERNLFLNHKLKNIYSDTAFATSTHFVSEAHLIEGDWIGYYSFQDADDTMEDWFDGPMYISIKIVPLEDQSGEPITQSSWLSRWLAEEQDDIEIDEPRKRRKTNNNSLVSTIQNASKYSHTSKKSNFPSKYLKTCPLTRFEGTGRDNLGNFSITGLIDDTEEGQVTWEKNYIDSGETWEYSGRFIWPMGLSGRWGDEEYGGPWWMWKSSENNNSSVAK